MARDKTESSDSRIIAVGFLTRREVEMFGAQLARLYPVEECTAFADLVEAIDEADREFHRSSNCRSG